MTGSCRPDHALPSYHVVLGFGRLARLDASLPPCRLPSIIDGAPAKIKHQRPGQGISPHNGVASGRPAKGGGQC